MTTENSDDKQPETQVTIVAKVLSPQAKRALLEADERRKKTKDITLPIEIGGRGGVEPVRFGDYEIKGRAIDF